MAKPKSLVDNSEDGYYWVQIYIEDSETLSDPVVAQLYTDVFKKRQIAWLDQTEAFHVPSGFVWLDKLTPPDRLEADLG